MSVFKEVIEYQSNGSCNTAIPSNLNQPLIAEMNLLIPSVLVSFIEFSQMAYSEQKQLARSIARPL